MCQHHQFFDKNFFGPEGVEHVSVGAHSTRGAGVGMYKSLGLPSEQVCEIGGWKDIQSFSSHYLRLGAARGAAASLQKNFVHRSSSQGSAEPDCSRTPGTKDTGGREQEGGAQSWDEVTLLVAGGVFNG